MSGQGEANSAQIAEIRARAEGVLAHADAWHAGRRSGHPGALAFDLATDVLALVAVVEAWDDFAGEWGHASNCFHRASARGWTPGDPPMLDCVCGLARLEEALTKIEAVDA